MRPDFRPISKPPELIHSVAIGTGFVSLPKKFKEPLAGPIEMANELKVVILSSRQISNGQKSLQKK